MGCGKKYTESAKCSDTTGNVAKGYLKHHKCDLPYIKGKKKKHPIFISSVLPLIPTTKKQNQKKKIDKLRVIDLVLKDDVSHPLSTLGHLFIFTPLFFLSFFPPRFLAVSMDALRVVEQLCNSSSYAASRNRKIVDVGHDVLRSDANCGVSSTMRLAAVNSETLSIRQNSLKNLGLLSSSPLPIGCTLSCTSETSCCCLSVFVASGERDGEPPPWSGVFVRTARTHPIRTVVRLKNSRLSQLPVAPRISYSLVMGIPFEGSGCPDLGVDQSSQQKLVIGWLYHQLVLLRDAAVADPHIPLRLVSREFPLFFLGKRPVEQWKFVQDAVLAFGSGLVYCSNVSVYLSPPSSRPVLSIVGPQPGLWDGCPFGLATARLAAAIRRAQSALASTLARFCNVERLCANCSVLLQRTRWDEVNGAVRSTCALHALYIALLGLWPVIPVSSAGSVGEGWCTSDAFLFALEHALLLFASPQVGKRRRLEWGTGDRGVATSAMRAFALCRLSLVRDRRRVGRGGRAGEERDGYLAPASRDDGGFDQYSPSAFFSVSPSSVLPSSGSSKGSLLASGDGPDSGHCGPDGRPPRGPRNRLCIRHGDLSSVIVRDVAFDKSDAFFQDAARHPEMDSARRFVGCRDVCEKWINVLAPPPSPSCNQSSGAQLGIKRTRSCGNIAL